MGMGEQPTVWLTVAEFFIKAAGVNPITWGGEAITQGERWHDCLGRVREDSGRFSGFLILRDLRGAQLYGLSNMRGRGAIADRGMDPRLGRCGRHPAGWLSLPRKRRQTGKRGGRGDSNRVRWTAEQSTQYYTGHIPNLFRTGTGEKQ